MLIKFIANQNVHIRNDFFNLELRYVILGAVLRLMMNLINQMLTIHIHSHFYKRITKSLSHIATLFRISLSLSLSSCVRLSVCLFYDFHLLTNDILKSFSAVQYGARYIVLYHKIAREKRKIN